MEKYVLSPAKTALLVIDMQNDFCSEGGYFNRIGYEIQPLRSIIPNIRRLLFFARKKNWLIVHTKAIHEECTLEQRHHTILPKAWTGRNEDRKLCIRGSWGAEVISQLKPKPGELVIEKYRYSAFYNTNLEILLRNRGIKNLVFTGVTTHTCVQSTLMDAFFRDFDVVLVSDCTASHSRDLYESTLKTVEHTCGIVVSSSETMQM